MPTRRTFLRASAAALASRHLSAAPLTQVVARRSAPMTPIRALVFDVFGTVVDWRTSVARDVEAVARRKGVTVDGAGFADAWRAAYAPNMNRVRTRELPWTKLDRLHRMTLDRLLVDFKLALSEEETDALNRSWHRLRPWPDAVSGLTRLKRKFTIAPLSNGNISLMTNMAKHAGLPWDCILGAELVQHYKPDREVYESAADFLDLPVDGVMMVAAHLNDLRAAKEVGLRTVFVPRPLELGPAGTPDLVADGSVDLIAKDFNDLARLLDA